MKQFCRAIGATKPEHWFDALGWLFWTLLIGSLLPVWGGVLTLFIYDKWFGWDTFFKHGEFALYSAALLASTYRVLSKEINKPGFKVFQGLSVIGLIISTILFVSVTVSDFMKFPINLALLISFSFWLFAFSVAISFIAELLKNIALSPDIEGIQKKGMNNFEKEFDQLS